MAPSIYKYYLDGRPFSEPIGWEKWEETTTRDKLLNGLITTIDVAVEFTGKSYDYLYELKQTQGKDGRAILTVEQYNGARYVRIYRGTIFVTDIEYNRTIGIAKAKVQDDSYYARINNNKQVPCVISSGKSKNGKDIALPEPYMVELRKVDDNTSLARSIYTVRLIDMFKTLVAFMSDGEVDFVSDTMESGTLEAYCITKGLKLYSTDVDTYSSAETDPMPEINFQQALQEIGRKFPLGMAIERVGDRPRIRVEEAGYFFLTSRTLILKTTEIISETTDVDKLYAKIRLGSGQLNQDSTYPFPEDITFFGFKEEEVPVQGIGNIDKELTLSTNWIVSSNLIQLMTEDINNEYDGEYDGEVVLLQTVKPFPNTSSGYTLNENFLGLGPAQYFFNPGLTNNVVAERFMDAGGIPDSMLKFIFPDALGFLFRAKLGANQTYVATANDVFDPAGLDTEVFDERGSYNNATYRYTASRGGLFTFRANARIQITNQYTAPDIFWRITIRHYSSTGTELGDALNTNDNNLYAPNYTGTAGIKYYRFSAIGTFDLGGLTKTLNMAKDDYCVIRIEKNLGGAGDIDYTIKEENTYFECIQAVVSGDVNLTGAPVKYRATLNKFDHAIKGQDYDRTIENQRSTIYASDANGNECEGWIEQMVYNRLTSEIKLSLLSTQGIT